MSNSIDRVTVSSTNKNCRRNTQLKSAKSDFSSAEDLLYRVIHKVYSVQNLLTGDSNMLRYRIEYYQRDW